MHCYFYIILFAHCLFPLLLCQTEFFLQEINEGMSHLSYLYLTCGIAKLNTKHSDTRYCTRALSSQTKRYLHFIYSITKTSEHTLLTKLTSQHTQKEYEKKNMESLLTMPLVHYSFTEKLALCCYIKLIYFPFNSFKLFKLMSVKHTQACICLPTLLLFDIIKYGQNKKKEKK